LGEPLQLFRESINSLERDPAMTTLHINYDDHLKTTTLKDDNGQSVTTDATKFGQDQGQMSPTDMLAAALGSCVLSTIGYQAEQIGVEIDKMTATIDKVMSDGKPRRIGHITLDIEIMATGNVSDRHQEMLTTAGSNCPVHHSLHDQTTVEMTINFAG
jgi:uncharacterized OsmC-like protein